MDSALLLFLSRFNTRNTAAQEYAGILPDGSTVTLSGFQTNEAPCHYLLRCAENVGDKITTILCITSREDTLPVFPFGPTSESYFKESITRMLRTDAALQRFYGDSEISFVSIPYDFDEGIDYIDKTTRTKRLYRHINDHLSCANAPKRLYIDYTGGPRDTTFLITELSRFLAYSGISCGCIAYSNMQEKQLVTLSSEYNMFRLLNAIHDFTYYGRADTLQEIYRDLNNPVVNQLLNSLTRFSEAISLCALDNIAEILSQIRQAVTAMENYLPQPNDDVIIRMLKDFLPQICEKFHLAQTEGNAELDLIDWCLHNGLLQQALTLFTEKVPEICFRNSLLDEQLIDSDFLPGQGKSRWVYGMYDNLFRQLRSKDDIGEFRRYLTTVQERKQTQKLSYPKAIRACAEMDHWSPICRTAIGRFADVVELSFSSKDGARTEAGQAMRFYGKSLPARNIATFIKNVLEDDQTLHFFVYQNEGAWQLCCNQESKDLVKKMNALNYLRANPDTDISAYTQKLSGEQLYKLLAGYFAVKMLRNHASHAAGGNAPEIRYCYEQGLIDKPSVQYSTVMCALTDMSAFLRSLLSA